MTLLRYTHSEAEKLLNHQIEIATQLLTGDSISNKEKLAQAKTAFGKWERYNETLLQKIFTTSTIANEVFHDDVTVYADPNSFAEERQQFVDNVNRRKTRLEAVANRINLFDLQPTAGKPENATANQHEEPPSVVRNLLWLANPKNWKKHPWITSLTAILLLFGLGTWLNSFRNTEAQTTKGPEVSKPIVQPAAESKSTDPKFDIRVGTVRVESEGLYRKLVVAVYNRGSKIAFVNGLDMKLKKSWRVSGIEKPTEWGSWSENPFDIEVDTSKNTPISKKLGNVSVPIKPNDSSEIAFTLKFSPLNPQELTIYQAAITLHCDDLPNYTVDNILISSPRSPSLVLIPTGKSPVSPDAAKKLFAAISGTSSSKLSNDIQQQLKNRNSAIEIEALPPPAADYLLPVELKNVLDEILTAPPAG